MDISQWTTGELGARSSPIKYTVVPTADIACTFEPGGRIPTISDQFQAIKNTNSIIGRFVWVDQ